MKKKSKIGGILLIILAIIIMQLPLSEADAATSASDFVFDGKILVSYKGTEKDVSIPTTAEIIGKGAFEDNTSIESVTIPYSVKRMKAFVFWGCSNLSKVSFGSGLSEVGDYVFNNCMGLKNITIPSHIHSIGVKAFADCVNLTDIVIPPEVTFIHESAFDGCKKLVIHADEGSYAWKYAQDFYERQKEMPEYEDVPGYDPDEHPDAPDDSEEEVTPPDRMLLGTTTLVSNHAVVFMDGNQKVYGGEKGEASDLPGSDRPIYDKDGNLLKFRIVDQELVADQAYYRSEEIKNCTLPDTIREIGQFSFARSTLQSIQLPQGLTRISYGAFYHCDLLAEVSLPDTVMSVEPKAFEHTKWLFDFLEGKGESGSDFLISGGVLVAYRGRNSGVVIPEGVRVIAAEAFVGHDEISTLKLPDSLLVIGEDAFLGCDSLSTIMWGKSLKQIKDRAFADCPLSAVSIPETVTELGLGAFSPMVRVTFQGKQPKTTYEESAKRLSNEAYRPVSSDKGTPGVEVTGMYHCSAHLDGADRAYTLTITETEKHPEMMRAFVRNLGMDFPEEGQILEFTLCDDSKVPITRLGRQPLTVTIPLESQFFSQKIKVVALDRNGQLEELTATKVRLDGMNAVRFQMNYVSDIAVFSCGEDYSGEITEISTEMMDMSAPPATTVEKTVLRAVRSRRYDKWIIGGLFLALGFFLLGRKVK